MVIIKYFISSKELVFLKNNNEVSEKEKFIESGSYESDLEIDDFVEKLRAKVISISNHADIVSYKLEDTCFIEIKLISKEENNIRTQKQSSRIFKFLNASYDVNLIPKNENLEEFIQIIFEDVDSKFAEKIVEELKKKESIHFKSHFKKTTQHFIIRNRVSVENFLDFVINVKPESFIESVNLIKDGIKKSGPEQIVVTNEKLRSSLSKLIGHQVSLQTHSWNSQKQVRFPDNEENLMLITFISSYEKVAVIIDEHINIIDYKVFGINEPIATMFSKSSIESKIFNGF